MEIWETVDHLDVDMQSVVSSNTQDKLVSDNLEAMTEQVKVYEEFANAKGQFVQVMEGDRLDAAYKFMEEHITLVQTLGTSEF